MADTGGPSQERGLEPRVARLESDVAEIRSILHRLAPHIDEMHGFLTAKLPGLATKAELIDLRSEMRTEFAGVQREMTELRSEMRTEFAGVQREMTELRSEMRTEFAGVRREMTELRSETKTEIADLRTELKSEIAELRVEILQRPTRRQAVFDIFAIVGLIGVILTIASHFAH
jgi:chromosome segregation ATPase